MLTPADFGIMSAALDDALSAGFGDDDCVETIVQAMVSEAGFADDAARPLAYDFFRANV